MVYLQVGTFNARGLRNRVKRAAFFDFVGSYDLNIAFVQEVHLRDRGDVKMFGREWHKGDSLWSVGGVHSSGVGVLFTGIRVEQSFVIEQGRVLGADVQYGSIKLRVIAVYGPQRLSEWEGIWGQIEPHLATNREIIFGGDFNIDLGREKEGRGAHWCKFLSARGLVDGGLSVRPRMDGPTWRNSRGAASRLDYIFFSRSLSPVSGRVLPLFFSDHDGVLFKVRCDVPVFGPGYWRMNTRILEVEDFNVSFTSLWCGLRGTRSMYDSVVDWWEVTKEKIREFIIRYCRKRAQRKRREMSCPQRFLELEYAIGNYGGIVNQQACDLYKAQLREAYDSRARAYLERSRLEFLEKNETCSAAFFNSVRVAKGKQVFYGIRDGQGSVVTGAEEMVRVATDHFKSVFKLQEVDVGGGEVFLNLLTQRVPTEITQAMETPLTLKELEGALRSMNRRRVPGIDGLPAEFYLRFWGLLGPTVLEVLTVILHTGKLGRSMAKGVISLLYKKGDATNLKNWRPLTMLCLDYKLLAKVLAKRLGTALPHVVHVDQTCGVAGRSLRWNLQLVRDAIAWADDRHLPLMVVGLDQAKAFDRVHWGFMFRVLGRLGFGKVFVGWLRILYTAVGSTVSVNGHLGDFFDLHAGVRQGCPLSPLLYVLYMEPLAAAIRADANIQGFLIPGSGGLRVKLSQYADDTTLLLDNDACLCRSLEVFQDFGRVSGAELNLTKSKVKFFGLWKGRTDVPGGLSLCDGPLKILGVNFETAQSASTNWDGRFEIVRKKLSLWKSRHLSLIGKVLVLKVAILPSLLHLAYVYPMPACLRRPLIRLVFDFMWGGRYEYVARARMLMALCEGGRDVPHLPLKLDCIFVCWLFKELSSPVVHPSGYFLRVFFSYQARHIMVGWSQLAPRAEQQPWHYRHAATWLRTHPEARDPAVALHHRVMYGVVRGGVGAPPMVAHPARVWIRVQPRGLDNGLKDLNWLCIHKSLPVRAIMHRHGLAGSARCPRVACTADETIRHVFWECTFAGLVWSRASHILNEIDPGFVLTWERVELGVGEARRRGRDRFLLWLVISLTKRGMWQARKDLVGKNRDMGTEGVFRKLKEDVKSLMKNDFKKWGKEVSAKMWKGGLGIFDFQ